MAAIAGAISPLNSFSASSQLSFKNLLTSIPVKIREFNLSPLFSSILNRYLALNPR